MLSKVDEKGRLYLGKKRGKQLGKEVFIVELKSGILLIPKPEDPVKSLETLGASLPDVPMKELRKEIAEEAAKEEQYR
jgi:hypothetical protein